jgi:hypothetical protein
MAETPAGFPAPMRECMSKWHFAPFPRARRAATIEGFRFA